jgi:hypothetical protein
MWFLITLITYCAHVVDEYTMSVSSVLWSVDVQDINVWIIKSYQAMAVWTFL